LTAGAFATHTLLVVCQPTITVTKTADTVSKVGDPVSYTIQVCNTGLVTVTAQSVIDTLLGDITASFAATLAPGVCDDPVTLSRTVLAGDPDPLVNTVTATYTAGIQTATAVASATTALFQPAVDVTKSCSPDPIQVGQAETCTIVVTNTSSGDSPDLENGTIIDTLTGDLLDPANTAIVDSDCAETLPVGGSCTIHTTRVVLASDPSPLANTVTVHYNPVGFPNDITASATASVTIEATPFEFVAVNPVCVSDVPFISIEFQSHPELDGHVGTLSFFDINNVFIESRSLTFQSNTTVNVIYPGATMDAEGNATDWPGWILNADGFWVTDPTDAIWRDGLNLVYTVNPTATAFVAYPPSTSACASPTGPFPPTTTPPTTPPLPRTGVDLNMAGMAGSAAVLAGCIALLAADELRRRRLTLGSDE
jgi:uncharacterized repeat protein (TIGR01451 family)